MKELMENAIAAIVMLTVAATLLRKMVRSFAMLWKDVKKTIGAAPAGKKVAVKKSESSQTAVEQPSGATWKDFVLFAGPLFFLSANLAWTIADPAPVTRISAASIAIQISFLALVVLMEIIIYALDRLSARIASVTTLIEKISASDEEDGMTN